jgi:hypothetical protein
VSVLVELSIDDFHFTSVGENLRDQLEIRITALDAAEKPVHGHRQTLGLDLNSRTHQSMLRYGLRAMSGMELPPGAYRLRVFVHERGADRRGSVFYDLDIPACGKKPTVMGGVFLGSLKETIVPIATTADEKTGFDFPPSTRRAFESDDHLLIQTEVCALAASHVDVSSRILGSDGKALLELTKGYELGDAATSQPAIVHQERIPLESLSTGDYLLELIARDPGSGHETRRQIPFEIISSI